MRGLANRTSIGIGLLTMGGEGDTTAPTLSSAFTLPAGNPIFLSYNETLDTGSVPDAGDFTVGTVSGISVSSVTVNGSNVWLTLDRAIAYDDVVTVDYTPGANPIQDASGNEASAFSGRAVSNGSTLAFMRDSYGNRVTDSYGDDIPLPH